MTLRGRAGFKLCAPCRVWCAALFPLFAVASTSTIVTSTMSEMATTESTTESDSAESTAKTSTDSPPRVFQCDALSILGHSHDVTLHRCTGGTCYATDMISTCGGYGTQCCAPRISLCSSGATCFATAQIDTCMPWAACCAPKVTTCLSPSCSTDFPACMET
ncbi:unnamed protein product [Symbiodinium natans]|uniref:Granulins domain-containing protein n=1 Tax=Symbiodinium natans TaxID=878477 RepID=A0A812V8D5_9DINO|nr:unnamed protein product [Symbiodinium natans]